MRHGTQIVDCAGTRPTAEVENSHARIAPRRAAGSGRAARRQTRPLPHDRCRGAVDPGQAGLAAPLSRPLGLRRLAGGRRGWVAGRRARSALGHDRGARHRRAVCRDRRIARQLPGAGSGAHEIRAREGSRADRSGRCVRPSRGPAARATCIGARPRPRILPVRGRAGALGSARHADRGTAGKDQGPHDPCGRPARRALEARLSRSFAFSFAEEMAETPCRPGIPCHRRTAGLGRRLRGRRRPFPALPAGHARGARLRRTLPVLGAADLFAALLRDWLDRM